MDYTGIKPRRFADFFSSFQERKLRLSFTYYSQLPKSEAYIYTANIIQEINLGYIIKSKPLWFMVKRKIISYFTRTANYLSVYVTL